MPKVSICIPAYKQVKFLKQTLESVLSQDFMNYELIVSDDSPDDAVKKLLDEYDFKGKLRYFRNSPALGSPANWNYCMSKATGEYIKILHHDDFFTSSQSLKKFVMLLDDNPDSYFAFSGTEIDLLALKMKKINSCSEAQFKKMIKSPDRLFFANYIGAPSATIVRNVKVIPFDVNLKWLVDIDWYVQQIKNSPGVVRTKEALICTIHGGEGQITQAVVADREVQIKEHVYLFDKLYMNDLDLKKYSLFFQILFHKYELNDIKQLRTICTVPEKLKDFFEEVFTLKSNSIFLKKVVYWLKKKSFNDHLFTLKTYFK